MSQGKYEQALPYAEAGAGSGSSWGFRVYLECLTALGEWEKAEQVARADSYRYRTNLWFAWCASTGRGDLESAWQLEQQRLRRFDQLGHSNVNAEKIWYYMGQGDDQAALDHLTELLEAEYRPWYAIMQAQLADAVGNTELRDQSLVKLAAWKPDSDDQWSVYNHLAPLLQQAIKDGTTLSLEDTDPIFEGRDDQERWLGGTMFTFAEFNRVHGQGDEKFAYLHRLARADVIDIWPRVLAWARLRQEGQEPEKLSDRNFEMQYRADGE